MKTLILFLLINSYLLSAPAFSKMREFQNGDGTTFMAKAQGNQYLNWIETEDGEILKYNQLSSNYEYAKIEENSLKSSGTKYEKKSSIRARSISRIKRVTKTKLFNLQKLRRVAENKKRARVQRF